jgi:hypothetical protein
MEPPSHSARPRRKCSLKADSIKKCCGMELTTAIVHLKDNRFSSKHEELKQ